MEGDGLYPTNTFLDENSRVPTRDGGHLQAVLFVAAPVDVIRYPVEGHGGDGVPHEFETLSLRGQDGALQFKGAE